MGDLVFSDFDNILVYNFHKLSLLKFYLSEFTYKNVK